MQKHLELFVDNRNPRGLEAMDTKKRLRGTGPVHSVNGYGLRVAFVVQRYGLEVNGVSSEGYVLAQRLPFRVLQVGRPASYA